MALDLGYTVRDLTASMGFDELGYWMAYYEQYEPHLTDDRRAAKLAFFAANNFAKPIRWQEMAKNFGLETRRRALRDAPQVLAAIGQAMPDHIRSRFH